MSKTRATEMFQAFADETRLRILHLLHTEETCVGDLVEILRIPQPTASRHLSCLRKAGLVEVRKEGLWHHYRLAQPEDRLHQRLLQCIGCCFDEVPAMRADRARALRLRQTGGCCSR